MMIPSRFVERQMKRISVPVNLFQKAAEQFGHSARDTRTENNNMKIDKSGFLITFQDIVIFQ